MRFFFFRAVWLSSVVTAELITITEWRKCSTSAVFPVPTSNITHSASPSSSSSSLVAASPRPTGPILGSTGPGATAGLSQSDKVDYLFWLEFAKAVRSAAQIMPDDNSAFFIGSTAQRGPPAGDNIPESYTNQGLYSIANNLLNDTSIFYTPAATNSYIDALSK